MIELSSELMAELSPKQCLVLQSALQRAWDRAVRNDLVTQGNADGVVQALVEGAIDAITAGQCDEAPVAAAALARLGTDNAGVLALDAAFYHEGGVTIH